MLEKAELKYGLVLASEELGWESTPKVAGTFWRRLRHYMATCELNVVHEGCRVIKLTSWVGLRTEDWCSMPVRYGRGWGVIGVISWMALWAEDPPKGSIQQGFPYFVQMVGHHASAQWQRVWGY